MLGTEGFVASVSREGVTGGGSRMQGEGTSEREMKQTVRGTPGVISCLEACVSCCFSADQLQDQREQTTATCVLRQLGVGPDVHRASYSR